MGDAMPINRNPKSKARNPKQILNSKVGNRKRSVLRFQHSDLEFPLCLEFRISNLEFFARRRAFTLVELLVVVVIIAMLMALTMAGMAAARQSAREDRTRATIAKIHSVIMPLYDEYKYRRVPITNTLPNIVPSNPPIRLGPREFALARLTALRDLMRLEMPERETDLLNNPIAIQFTLGTQTGSTSVPPPPLWQAYRAKVGTKMSKNGPAECLYMVVTMAGGEDARKLFNDSEIGDTDGNGLPEFIDGWGKPIYWLRWAPGFNESDIQPNVPPMTAAEAANRDHDPFDSRKVDIGWRLVPLIYSAGPDEEYGLEIDSGVSGSAYSWNSVSSHYQAMWGKPVTSGSTAGTHSDNIHNHQLQAR